MFLRKFRKHLLALVLVILCLIAYDPLKFENTSGDTISARYWPVAILQHHTIYLDPFKTDLKNVNYAALHFGETWIPRTDWGLAVLTIPVYAVAHFLDLGGEEWTHDRISYLSRSNAILIAIGSVLLLYFFLNNFVSPFTAFLSAALFAFGTWNWSMAAQGLTSQSASLLITVLIMIAIWRFCLSPRWPTAALLGLLCAWLWATRPSELPLVFPIIPLLVTRKRLPSFLFAGAILTGLIMLGYNYMYETPYGWRDALMQVNTETSPQDQFWTLNIFPGLLGLLFSPNRGAIVFFPLLLLVPFIWHRYYPIRTLPSLIKNSIRLDFGQWHSSKIVRGIPVDFLTFLIAGTILFLTSISALTFWHSTWSYGARYLYNLLPFTWIFLTLVFQDIIDSINERKLKPPVWLVTLFTLFSLQGVFIHWLGHRNFDIYVWNSKIVDIQDRHAWDFDNLMIPEVIEAGENYKRWPKDALTRLRHYGF